MCECVFVVRFLWYFELFYKFAHTLAIKTYSHTDDPTLTVCVCDSELFRRWQKKSQMKTYVTLNLYSHIEFWCSKRTNETSQHSGWLCEYNFDTQYMYYTYLYMASRTWIGTNCFNAAAFKPNIILNKCVCEWLCLQIS